MAVGAPGKFLDTSVATLRGEDATIAELRKTYPAELLDLKNLFTEWSDADLLFALDEAGGAVDLAFYRISDGMLDTTILRPSDLLTTLFNFPQVMPRDGRRSSRRIRRIGKR